MCILYYNFESILQTVNSILFAFSHRFSSDSYITNKSNYRKAYRGDYTNHTSPTTTKDKQQQSAEPTPSINPPRQETMVHVTKVLTVNNNNITTSSTVTQMEHKPHHRNSDTPPASPWNKSYSPVQHFGHNMRRHSSQQSVGSGATPPHTNPTTPINSRGNSVSSLDIPDSSAQDEVTESPSVKTFVANIEGRQNKDWSTRGSHPPVIRPKLNELKHTLLKSSSENLSTDTVISPTPPGGKRSRSNSKENVLITNSGSEGVTSPSSHKHSSNDDVIPSSRKCRGNKDSRNSSGVVADFHEIGHHRDRSDPQSDGDTRSNDSGVSEDLVAGQTMRGQKSQEELDCEKQALIIASQLQDQDRNLFDVEYKSSTDYVSGLFDTKVSLTHKTSIRVSTLNRNRSDSVKDDKSTSSGQKTPNR